MEGERVARIGKAGAYYHGRNIKINKRRVMKLTM